MTPWAELRRRGFYDAVAEAGCACQARHHARSFGSLNDWEEAQQELTAWLARLPKPLGLMACSDRHAQNVLDACRRAGIAVPDEVAVIGSDNDEAICRLTDPSLSSVADNPGKIGYEAAGLLDQLMAGHTAPPRPLLIPPRGIATRRSTDMIVIEDKLVTRALRFIREHACEPIDVNTVVRTIPLSRSALYRRFRKAVGQSPHEQILRVRLDRVKQLLTQTSLSVARVAALAGFQHPEYMAAAFKRETGMTPGGYRAQHHRRQ